jgi:hypothetical protein
MRPRLAIACLVLAGFALPAGAQNVQESRPAGIEASIEAPATDAPVALLAEQSIAQGSPSVLARQARRSTRAGSRPRSRSRSC